MGWLVCYVYESPHKDRKTEACVHERMLVMADYRLRRPEERKLRGVAALTELRVSNRL